MLQWIEQHSDMLNVLVGLGTLVVWLLYLQIFLHHYRRQTTPSILITRAGGSDLDARCVLSNMSGEAIHLQSLICTLEEADSEVSSSVDDIDEISDDWQTGGGNLRYGPVRSGEALSVGRFGDILRRLREDGGYHPGGGGRPRASACKARDPGGRRLRLGRSPGQRQARLRDRHGRRNGSR